MEKKLSLRKKERLASEKDFEMIIAEGKYINAYPFRLVYLRYASETESKTQIKTAVSVPKKRIKLAVNRNKVKRLFREAYRLNKQQLIDYAIANKITFRLLFVYTGKAEEAEFNIFTTKIILLLQRLKSTNESRKGSADTSS